MTSDEHIGMALYSSVSLPFPMSSVFHYITTMLLYLTWIQRPTNLETILNSANFVVNSYIHHSQKYSKLLSLV